MIRPNISLHQCVTLFNGKEGEREATIYRGDRQGKLGIDRVITRVQYNTMGEEEEWEKGGGEMRRGQEPPVPPVADITASFGILVSMLGI